MKAHKSDSSAALFPFKPLLSALCACDKLNVECAGYQCGAATMSVFIIVVQVGRQLHVSASLTNAM